MRIVSLLLVWIGLMTAGVPAAAQPAAAGEQAAFERAIEDTKTAVMADPQAALGKSDVALERAAALPPQRATLGRATAMWLKIEAYIGLNRLGEAEDRLREALPLVERYGRNTKLHGDLTRSKGAIAALRGNVQQALRDYLAAYRIFRRAGEKRSQAIALQDIGQIYWEAGDYKRMLRYLEQAQEIYDDDPAFSLTTSNNTGEALRALGRGDEAEREYEAALEAARRLDSALLQTRILSNLALVQIDEGKLDAATRNAQRALAVGAAPEAADWLPFVYGVMAKIAAARGEDARAGELLERAFAGVDLTQTELVFKEFHELGAQVFERLGRPGTALAHLRAFQRLDSEARDLTSSASSQLLAARFDFTNQNLRISQLKQGQLQRDVQIERQRVEFRTTLFTGLAIAGAIVMALVMIAFFSIRRSRNEVRAANEVLTQVNVDLEKALKAKTDFLAMTSHEIRTPLNGILGMTQVMLANRHLEPGTRDQVQLVQGAGETMKALVDDILDVAKMETGEVAVQIEPAPLRSILEDAVNLWRSEALAKALALEADLAAAPELMETDGGRVRQIVFNLLSNAIKFTPGGSVRLVTGRANGGETLLIIVEDTGIGIPEDQHTMIFEAFHQVDSAMTRQFSGTGLGLAICRNLVEALGGTIALESAPGKGSRFTVSLPLREIDAASASARPNELAKARVGLIDANEMRRAKMNGLIEPHVASTCGLANGEAGLDLLARDGIDLLVIDAASASFQAEEVLETLGRLIERAAERQVPTCVLLAPDEHLTIEAVAKLGPTALLLKPLKGSELIGALRKPYIDASPGAAFARVA